MILLPKDPASGVIKPGNTASRNTPRPACPPTFSAVRNFPLSSLPLWSFLLRYGAVHLRQSNLRAFLRRSGERKAEQRGRDSEQVFFPSRHTSVSIHPLRLEQRGKGVDGCIGGSNKGGRKEGREEEKKKYRAVAYRWVPIPLSGPRFLSGLSLPSPQSPVRSPVPPPVPGSDPASFKLARFAPLVATHAHIQTIQPTHNGLAT